MRRCDLDGGALGRSGKRGALEDVGDWRCRTNWVVAVFTGPERTVYVTWAEEDSRYRTRVFVSCVFLSSLGNTGRNGLVVWKGPGG